MMQARVLIVDDNPDDIVMIQRFLENDPVEVRGITDSSLAEAAFAEFEPDIVLLDLHMPSPDGMEILQRLQGARDALGFIPVVVLTGDHFNVARNSALVRGADDFLTKPLDRHDVVFRVRNLLRTRRLFVDLAREKEALQQKIRKTD
jgi:putative two-component system response regulator